MSDMNQHFYGNYRMMANGQYPGALANRAPPNPNAQPHQQIPQQPAFYHPGNVVYYLPSIQVKQGCPFPPPRMHFQQNTHDAQLQYGHRKPMIKLPTPPGTSSEGQFPQTVISPPMHARVPTCNPLCPLPPRLKCLEDLYSGTPKKPDNDHQVEFKPLASQHGDGVSFPTVQINTSTHDSQTDQTRTPSPNQAKETEASSTEKLWLEVDEDFMSNFKSALKESGAFITNRAERASHKVDENLENVPIGFQSESSPNLTQCKAKKESIRHGAVGLKQFKKRASPYAAVGQSSVLKKSSESGKRKRESNHNDVTVKPDIETDTGQLEQKQLEHEDPLPAIAGIEDAKEHTLHSEHKTGNICKLEDKDRSPNDDSFDKEIKEHEIMSGHVDVDWSGGLDIENKKDEDHVEEVTDCVNDMASSDHSVTQETDKVDKTEINTKHLGIEQLTALLVKEAMSKAVLSLSADKPSTVDIKSNLKDKGAIENKDVSEDAKVPDKASTVDIKSNLKDKGALEKKDVSEDAKITDKASTVDIKSNLKDKGALEKKDVSEDSKIPDKASTVDIKSNLKDEGVLEKKDVSEDAKIPDKASTVDIKSNLKDKGAFEKKDVSEDAKTMEKKVKEDKGNGGKNSSVKQEKLCHEAKTDTGSLIDSCAEAAHKEEISNHLADNVGDIHHEPEAVPAVDCENITNNCSWDEEPLKARPRLYSWDYSDKPAVNRSGPDEEWVIDGESATNSTRPKKTKTVPKNDDFAKFNFKQRASKRGISIKSPEKDDTTDQNVEQTPKANSVEQTRRKKFGRNLGDKMKVPSSQSEEWEPILIKPDKINSKSRLSKTLSEESGSDVCSLKGYHSDQVDAFKVKASRRGIRIIDPNDSLDITSESDHDSDFGSTRGAITNTLDCMKRRRASTPDPKSKCLNPEVSGFKAKTGNNSEVENSGSLEKHDLGNVHPFLNAEAPIFEVRQKRSLSKKNTSKSGISVKSPEKDDTTNQNDGQTPKTSSVEQTRRKKFGRNLGDKMKVPSSQSEEWEPILIKPDKIDSKSRLSKTLSEESGSDVCSLKGYHSDLVDTFKVKASRKGIRIVDPNDSLDITSESDHDSDFGSTRGAITNTLDCMKSRRASTPDPKSKCLNPEVSEFKAKTGNNSEVENSGSLEKCYLGNCHPFLNAEAPIFEVRQKRSFSKKNTSKACTSPVISVSGVRHVETREISTNTESCDTRDVAVSTIREAVVERFIPVSSKMKLFSKSINTEEVAKCSVGVNVNMEVPVKQADLKDAATMVDSTDGIEDMDRVYLANKVKALQVELMFLKEKEVLNKLIQQKETLKKHSDELYLCFNTNSNESERFKSLIKNKLSVIEKAIAQIQAETKKIVLQINTDKLGAVLDPLPNLDQYLEPDGNLQAAHLSTYSYPTSLSPSQTDSLNPDPENDEKLNPMSSPKVGEVSGLNKNPNHRMSYDEMNISQKDQESQGVMSSLTQNSSTSPIRPLVVQDSFQEVNEPGSVLVDVKSLVKQGKASTSNELSDRKHPFDKEKEQTCAENVNRKTCKRNEGVSPTIKELISQKMKETYSMEECTDQSKVAESPVDEPKPVLDFADSIDSDDGIEQRHPDKIESKDLNVYDTSSTQAIAKDDTSSTQAMAKDDTSSTQAMAKDDTSSTQAMAKDDTSSSQAVAKDDTSSTQAMAKDDTSLTQAMAKDDTSSSQAMAKDDTISSLAMAKDDTNSSQAMAKDDTNSSQAKDDTSSSQAMAKDDTSSTQALAKDDTSSSLAMAKDNTSSTQAMAKDDTNSSQAMAKDEHPNGIDGPNSMKEDPSKVIQDVDDDKVPFNDIVNHNEKVGSLNELEESTEDESDEEIYVSCESEQGVKSEEEQGINSSINDIKESNKMAEKPAELESALQLNDNTAAVVKNRSVTIPETTASLPTGYIELHNDFVNGAETQTLSTNSIDIKDDVAEDLLTQLEDKTADMTVKNLNPSVQDGTFRSSAQGPSESSKENVAAVNISEDSSEILCKNGITADLCKQNSDQDTSSLLSLQEDSIKDNADGERLLSSHSTHESSIFCNENKLEASASENSKIQDPVSDIKSNNFFPMDTDSFIEDVGIGNTMGLSPTMNMVPGMGSPPSGLIPPVEDLDPMLFQAVIGQLIQAYPQMICDRVMLTNVAMQQTYLLHMYMKGQCQGEGQEVSVTAPSMMNFPEAVKSSDSNTVLDSDVSQSVGTKMISSHTPISTSPVMSTPALSTLPLSVSSSKVDTLVNGNAPKGNNSVNKSSEILTKDKVLSMKEGNNLTDKNSKDSPNKFDEKSNLDCSVSSSRFERKPAGINHPAAKSNDDSFPNLNAGKNSGLSTVCPKTTAKDSLVSPTQQNELPTSSVANMDGTKSGEIQENNTEMGKTKVTTNESKDFMTKAHMDSTRPAQVDFLPDFAKKHYACNTKTKVVEKQVNLLDDQAILSIINSDSVHFVRKTQSSTNSAEPSRVYALQSGEFPTLKDGDKDSSKPGQNGRPMKYVPPGFAKRKPKSMVGEAQLQMPTKRPSKPTCLLQQGEDWEAEIDEFPETFMLPIDPPAKLKMKEKTKTKNPTKPTCLLQQGEDWEAEVDEFPKTFMLRIDPHAKLKMKGKIDIAPDVKQKATVPGLPLEKVNKPVLKESSGKGISDISNIPAPKTTNKETLEKADLLTADEKENTDEWCEVKSRKRYKSPEMPVKKPSLGKPQMKPFTRNQPIMTNFEKLISRLREEFPGSSRQTIIEAVTKIRAQRGSLSGMTMEKIVESAHPFITKQKKFIPGLSLPPGKSSASNNVLNIPRFTKPGENNNTFTAKPVNRGASAPKPAFNRQWSTRHWSTQSSACNRTSMTKLSRERKPLSRESEPLSRESEPLSRESEPLSRESEPLSRESEPLSREPLSRESKPLSRESEPLSRESKPAQKAVLKLPRDAPSSKVNKPVFADLEEDICAICHDDLCMMEIKELDCHHVYHYKCISQWVELERTCPTCRKHALFPEDFPKLGK